MLANYPLHPDFAAKYSLGEELGSGGFGFAVSAYERQTGVERAVKFILRHRVPAHAWVFDTQLGTVPMEVFVLKNVSHPNIIQYIDFYQDTTFLYLVMELHGTQWTAAAAAATTTTSSSPSTASIPAPPSPALSQLSDDSSCSSSSLSSTSTSAWPDIDVHANPRLFVRRTSCDLFECIEHHRSFNEPLGRHIFRQIAECVGYLDRLGVCHRDLKDENIVIDDQYRVKIIDFGSTVLLPRHEERQQHPVYFNKFYGTVSFASPEIILQQPYRAEPAEVWALGVLLYTILFGEVPFQDAPSTIYYSFVPPRTQVSPECYHLISWMLEKHPERRPTIYQVLSHPWLNTI
ncbi:kinase-like domain-containing protein [Radiomyces spectabilis]|uniref:kinase-like domain-containing protein n=1 Tax=Radiomyces spectabilis TaxID=64574 RepID=UPI002220E190|nr:kinase-like domain-containing protein [Radiomyces spectabilis]KAI8379434.1 kinase-like domain-containing protein [Radiomyces spectabilis]